MIRCLSLLIFFSFFNSAKAQYTFSAVIKNAEGASLAGATLQWKEGKRSVAADSAGNAMMAQIPAGKQTFVISFVGMKEKTISLSFPLTEDGPLQVTMEHEEHEDEEAVVVTTTRTSRTITTTPTRVEIISGEELQEKGNMKPGDIRMLLNESTGIQTQQTSATSFNSSIRIQGLDGRYTQLLRDGFPLYAGFSGGLSIMQIAPLDLKQVEVIKGASSTLYGGGAIAGLVNLVSKTPGEEREISFLANATSAGGLDLSNFYSQRFGTIGITVFTSRNSNKPFDPAGIGLTAIPKFERYTVNPRLFLYGRKLEASLGLSFVTEDRIGGNVDYIKGNQTSGYYERNNTDRLTSQLQLQYQMNEQSHLVFKNSLSRFKRGLFSSGYAFEGQQVASFTELSYSRRSERSEWIAGFNYLTDDFEEKGAVSSTTKRDYHLKTAGLFVQNTWQPLEQFTLEAGLRGDVVSGYGTELLPRLSAMYRFSEKLTARVGGGLGYKTPTIFNEETERLLFRNLRAIDRNNTRNERSAGGNFDLNYRTQFGELGFSVNQLFFITRLNHPLVLVPAQADFELANGDGYINTKGIETNIKLTYADFKLFVGYTYADVAAHSQNTRQWFPLTAKHRLNNVLMYEIEEKLKLGLEAYYFSPQRLNDNSTGRSYWITGFMAEKIWERISVYINFENFTNTRQTRFDTIYTGTIDAPVFRDIYAPVEGFVVNGGIKLRL